MPECAQGEAEPGNTMGSIVSSVTLRSLTLSGRAPGRGAPASSGRHVMGLALCCLLALVVLVAMSSTGELPSVLLLLLILVPVILGYIVVAKKIYRYID